MAIDVALEERDAAPPEKIPSLPVVARFGVEGTADEAPVGGKVGVRIRFAEEPVERAIRGELADRGELELRQRHMRPVQVDRKDFGRVGGQVGEHVAAAGGDRRDPFAGLQLQGLQIDLWVFPYLRIDETLES